MVIGLALILVSHRRVLCCACWVRTGSVGRPGAFGACHTEKLIKRSDSVPEPNEKSSNTKSRTTSFSKASVIIIVPTVVEDAGCVCAVVYIVDVVVRASRIHLTDKVRGHLNNRRLGWTSHRWMSNDKPLHIPKLTVRPGIWVGIGFGVRARDIAGIIGARRVIITTTVVTFGIVVIFVLIPTPTSEMGPVQQSHLEILNTNM